VLTRVKCFPLRLPLACIDHKSLVVAMQLR
jgi:hypothetical protein